MADQVKERALVGRPDRGITQKLAKVSLLLLNTAATKEQMVHIFKLHVAPRAEAITHPHWLALPLVKKP